MRARERAQRAAPRKEERRGEKRKIEGSRQLDMSGKRCPCIRCSPCGQPFSFPWQERIIHYAYEWEFPNVELYPWLLASPSLYDHLTSRIFVRLAKPLQRISLVNQINDKYDMFSEYIQSGKQERSRLKRELIHCLDYLDGEVDGSFISREKDASREYRARVFIQIAASTPAPKRSAPRPVTRSLCSKTCTCGTRKKPTPQECLAYFSPCGVDHKEIDRPGDSPELGRS